MILKNKEIIQVIKILESIGNNQKDIKLRFDLSKKIKPLIQESNSINNQVQLIIKEEHEKDEKVDSISIYDKRYVELMDYDNDVDFNGLRLDYLAMFNPKMEELIALEKIIIE